MLTGSRAEPIHKQEPLSPLRLPPPDRNNPNLCPRLPISGRARRSHATRSIHCLAASIGNWGNPTPTNLLVSSTETGDLNRAPNLSSMATPTPIQIDPLAAAPRKLPIKRKKTPQPPPHPSHGLSPDPLLHLPPDSAFDDDEDFDDDADADVSVAAQGSVDVRSASGASAAVAPPFRFQRVWSESDEIRFLQGLLGCWSQGLVFPRDLNLFFDRFSESMPQPYTRSQLSEKLRRLRKKFRVMSTRITRGQDPARLAPHDRDVLHLCTRLWHPSYAATSPFSAPDALAPGSGGNKRRRPNPRPPSGPARADAPPPLPASPASVPVTTLPPPRVPLPPADDKAACATNGASVNAARFPMVKEEMEIKVEKDMETCKNEVFLSTTCKVEAVMVADEAATGKDVPKYSFKKIVLDVFDACLEEIMVAMGGSSLPNATKGSDLEKRWRELRITEMDIVARRMRLVLENTVKN
ncbi:hypothetical protein Cni_G06215 [Canna indica]|uniref:Glabrous enhancer-binding protein-like DBD domain-containing protein n=1 Tax=Canna indica TaxID=4628 RepID=A0AAQ3Q639_9LILI|nr:hypothetical protein Cni_G06215 [Canna indica]